MKKYLVPVSFVIFGLITSCSGDKTETTESSENAATEMIQTEPAADGITGFETPQQPDGSAPATAQPVAATTGNANVKLNPPHGEPGHMCEIAVGEPLPADGKAPAQNNNIQVQSGGPQGITVAPTVNNPAPVNIQPSQPAPGAATTTAPGMNPPHGEPGHDCAIPVGAPLKK